MIVENLEFICKHLSTDMLDDYPLGGPGSGKVTYCDNLIQEKEGITHINMMDLLQQYALGNGSCYMYSNNYNYIYISENNNIKKLFAFQVQLLNL